MVGDCPWTEALHDVIVETLHDFSNNVGKNVIAWKVFKRTPEPENSEQLIEKERTDLLKRLDYIKSLTEGRRKAFLFGDQVRPFEIIFLNYSFAYLMVLLHVAMKTNKIVHRSRRN